MPGPARVGATGTGVAVRVRRGRGVAATLASLGAAILLIAPGPAAPAEAAVNDPVLSGAASSMWQTNSPVDAMIVVRGVLYAGGAFTRVRPPGSAPGANETARTYLAAFNASTGALITTFNVTLNGRIYDLASSPDGTRLYLAGAFTTVNGVSRSRVAALSIPGGAVVTGFSANANAAVTAVDATSSAVYLGGDFTTVRGVARSRLASLDASTGAVSTAFSADVDARVRSIKVAPDGTRVLVGGDMNTVGGVATGGMASVDPVTGAVEEWKANQVQPINILCGGRVRDIVAEGDTAYVTGEGDPAGCYEGTYSARISDGELNWNSSCLGASQGLALMGGILYKASHQHDCAFNPGDAHGGFVGGTSRDTFVWQRLLGQNVADGTFNHWAPNTNGTGSAPVGPHVLATDGTQIFVGGDFTYVNNLAQQGLTRFTRTGNAAPIQVAAPFVRSTGVGRATITWPAVYDPDDGTLTYNLYRGSTLINSQTVESYPWSRPQLRYDDLGRTPGSTATYYLKISDGTVSVSSKSSSVTYRTTAPASYADVVASLSPSFSWDMSGTGTTIPDVSGNGVTAGLVGGATRGAGALPLADAAGIDLDGATGYLTSDSLQALSPSFSQSLWIRGTTIAGGSLFAVTDVQTGDGTYSDRAMTMDNNGNIVFSVHRPAAAGSPDPLGPRLNNVRLQGPIYNDGRWHHVVGTWDDVTGTAALYIDGSLNGTYVGTAGGLTEGYYRVGYTDLAKEQAVFGRNFYHLTWPGSEYLLGSVDQVSVFPAALTQAQVQELYAAGVNQGG